VKRFNYQFMFEGEEVGSHCNSLDNLQLVGVSTRLKYLDLQIVVFCTCANSMLESILIGRQDTFRQTRWHNSPFQGHNLPL
jgi:hypothetical protein